jgi:hypothetical protein
MDGAAYIFLAVVNQLITPLRPGPNGRNSSFVASFHRRTIRNLQSMTLDPLELRPVALLLLSVVSDEPFAISITIDGVVGGGRSFQNGNSCSLAREKPHPFVWSPDDPRCFEKLEECRGSTIDNR